VSWEAVGLAVLESLREMDSVAYLRFASVYKGFDDPADFEREAAVLSKATEPKRR
jgi:transcriptional repressor NrdR